MEQIGSRRVEVHTEAYLRLIPYTEYIKGGSRLHSSPAHHGGTTFPQRSCQAYHYVH